MGLPTSLTSVIPVLAGGGLVTVIFMAVWFANFVRRIAERATQNADNSVIRAAKNADEVVTKAEARLDREVTAHEATQKKLDDEIVRRRDAEERIRQLEWDVQLLKSELVTVKQRLVELEGNGT